MNSRRIDRLLTALDRARRSRGAQRGVESLLSALSGADFRSADPLLRFHEALLYFCAHPGRPGVLLRAKRLLSSFAARVESLARSGADLSPLEEPGSSGIAGTSVTTTFSFDLLLWLERVCPGALRAVRELQEDPERLASTLPRLLPLLEEESLADANVDYVSWLGAAAGLSGPGRIGRLLRLIERLDLTPAAGAELFDSVGLPVEWSLGRSRWSRTRLRLPGGPAFFHGEALLARPDFRFEEEIGGPALKISRLSKAGAGRALGAARAALATRYREMYGITHGEARGAIRAEAGRGVRFHLFGLPPERRLPLRAGYAVLVTRNGLPVGYGDGFALFERIDLSFNIFPEFRDGESAFVLAKLLKLYRQWLGVTVFSIDSYQIGDRNEEAIESGAFWFYRRLGFRPTSPDRERIARREEFRLAADEAYRSPARVLRRLAAGNMLYEPSPSGRRDWDRFRIRNLGLAVGRRMAARSLTPEEMRQACSARLARILSLDLSRVPPGRRRSFADLALILDLIPGLPRWKETELEALRKIVEAKSRPSEARYLRLLQGHARLRSEILRLGSAESGGTETTPGRISPLRESAPRPARRPDPR